MKKFLTFFIGLLAYSCSHATTYYVSNSGNDLNDGKSTSKPWKTFTKVGSSTLVPGDFVLLNRGESYLGTFTAPSSGTSVSPITLGDYGSGAIPTIDGGNSRANALALNNKSWITVRNIRFINCNGTSEFTAAIVIGPNTIQGIKIVSCVIEGNRRSGIVIGGGSTNVTNASYIIDSCTIDNNGDFGILPNSTLAFPLGSKITHCIVYSNGLKSKLDNREIGNLQGNFMNVEVAYNAIYDAAPGIAKDSITSHGIYVSTPGTAFAYIHDNAIYGNRNGDGIKARYSMYCYNNTFYGNGTNGIELGQNVDVSATYYVYRNFFYNNDLSAVVVNAQQVDNNPGDSIPIKVNAHIWYNTTYQNTIQGGNEIAANFNCDTLDIIGNIMNGRGTTVAIQIKDNASASASGVSYRDIDYNLYNRASAAMNGIYNGNNQPFLGWKGLVVGTNGVHMDIHSLVTDPRLVAPTGMLSLQSISPAIDAGIDVGLPFTGASPDIGAAEFMGGGIIPTTILPPVNHNNIVN